MNYVFGKNAVILDAGELLNLIKKLFNVQNIQYLSENNEWQTMDEAMKFISELESTIDNGN